MSEYQAGTHGFDGACLPGPGSQYVYVFATFSVGIFEWVPRANGKGVKRGPVKVRVRGKDVSKIRRRAREIAAELDAGAYRGPKNASTL